MMMMMMLLVLGAFIFGAFILGAISVLIYLLRELFYETMGVEKKPRAEEPLDKESVAVDCTIGVEPNPVSDTVTMETPCQSSCDTRRPIGYPLTEPLMMAPHVTAKRGYFAFLKTTFIAVEDFVLGDNTSSDSD